MSFFLEHGKKLASPRLSRREFLGFGALAMVAATLPRTALARVSDVPETERSLDFYNIHTGERLKAMYWVQGEYMPEPLADISLILRDYRANEVKTIDVRLLDLLHAIRTKLETRQPFHIISGYRSPATNSLLHRRSNGVALHSLHMEGKAVDVRLPDRDLSLLRQVSVALQGGGVGYYPRSDFVHLDVGRARLW